MPFLLVLPGKEEAPNRKYNKFCTDECRKKIKDGRLQCKCGEDMSIWVWHWENDPCPNLMLSNNSKDVLFHPIYSSGTAAVRGTVPFRQNMHHYWEVKMISKLYGTDVMVGVATSKLDYDSWKLSFCSMLGVDDNSYGYSYMGVIQHNKMRRRYGSKYGLGSIVGVHLDMCEGSMEYFLNRKPLGIAFRGLKNKEFYPMVSSTAAQSAVRITCSVSQEPTLQILCLKIVMNNRQLHEQYRNITGLTRIYDREYFWIRPSEEEPNEQKKLADLEKEDALFSLATSCRSCKRPRRSWLPILRGHSDLEDTSSSSSDEEESTRNKLCKKGETQERSSNSDEDFDIYKDILEYSIISDDSEGKNRPSNEDNHEGTEDRNSEEQKTTVNNDKYPKHQDIEGQSSEGIEDQDSIKCADTERCVVSGGSSRSKDQKNAEDCWGSFRSMDYLNVCQNSVEHLEDHINSKSTEY